MSDISWSALFISVMCFLSMLFLWHFIIYMEVSVKHTNIDEILQAGAPFGSCKNVAVPNPSPLTNTAGSFSGSVQFSRSASTDHSPSCLILFLFYFPLMAVFL